MADPTTAFMVSAALSFTPIHVDGLFIDGFAGGGGASTGIEQAIGRPVDIAVNHSPTAIAIHKANHPAATHYCQDIKALWPLAATKMQPVSGAWFSPDCKEFSKAKGAPVKDRSIRALCWEVVHWLKEVQPTCGYLENVEEFEYAAPLDEEGKPIKGQEGREFKRFVRAIRGLGYRVQWWVLKACDYGAPTSRKRLYMVMRRDGLPIVKPKPTHGAPDSPAVLAGKLHPYRTAAECIDWTIPCPSIFERDRELAEATNRRIAHGVMRYVVNAEQPFIVSRDGRPVLDAAHITKFRTGSVGSDLGKPMPTVTANGESARAAGATPLGIVDAKLAPFVTYGQHGGRNRSAQEPHHTIAASRKDTNGLVGVSLAEAAFIDRQFSKSTGAAVNEPLGATMAGGGGKSAAVTAFLSHFYGSDKVGGGGKPGEPLGTVRAGGLHHAVVAAHMEQANGGPRNKRSAGRSAGKPLSTVTTTGGQQRIVQTTMVEAGDLPPEMMLRATMVAAFLVKYYGTGGENEAAQIQAANRELDTITTKARFAVVTVTIDATTYVIVDIGLRMLTPRELANAQGFPPDYVLDPECWYTTKPSKRFPQGQLKFGRLPNAMQISAIGNSVCPPVARALVAANQPSERLERMAA